MQDETYPCRLYLISPPSIDLAVFPAQLEEALAAGDVGAFQLRLKDADDASIVAAARALVPVCQQYGVAFILNDRADLAIEVAADGIHLGQEDMSLKQARAILGEERVIGISCHDSPHMAMEAGEGGADYVAFGAFYPTESKSPEKLAQYGTPEPSLLQWWSTYTTIPCVAIGGLTPERAEGLVKAGADFVAAITAVWRHAKGPGAAVEEFNAAIRRGLKARTK